MRRVAALTAAMLVLLLLVSFGTARAQKRFRFAILLSGFITDQSWNQRGYEAAVRVARKYGVEMAFAEAVKVSDVEAVLRDFAARGFDLIIAHSFNFTEATIKVGQAYPERKFAIGTGYKTATNVAIYDWPAHEAGYLVGVMAGMMTRSNKIGAIGGFAIPDVIRIHEGYRLGAQAVNPRVQIFRTYVGSWRDQAKGREAALAQIETGVDVIDPVGDGMTVGVVKAAAERNVWVFGYFGDMRSLGPKVVLTSIVLNIDAALDRIVRDAMAGRFVGKPYLMTMREGGVQLAPFNPAVPASVRAKVEATRKAILDGSLQVPRIEELPK